MSTPYVPHETMKPEGVEVLCAALGFTNLSERPRKVVTNETIPWSRNFLSHNSARAQDLKQWVTPNIRNTWKETAQAFLGHNQTRAQELWPQKNSSLGLPRYPEDEER